MNERILDRIPIEDINPILEQYSGITVHEAAVIYLRRDKRTYRGIQIELGNVPKK